ncbi:MAG: hypothetical protein MJ166_09910 [Clostridia bacterium]|nr:hypothetical protein [Clostridia bacterium]
MFCGNCGADLNNPVGQYCPYCGKKFANNSTAAEGFQVLKADMPRSLHRNPVSEGPTGTVKVILKANNNPLAPACGTTYIMNLNNGMYQVRLELMEFDTDSTIEVPYGSYNSYLEQFSYSDTSLVNPSVIAKNNKSFTIDSEHNVELIIEVGALIKPQKVTLNYVKA